MLTQTDLALAQDEDHAALAAACMPGVGLCTVVGIEGSFSRRVGAQLAVLPDGTTIGSLADSCLEAQLAADMAAAKAARTIRYGAGSRKIDFRLPCGGGLDILLDPAPDRRSCRRAMDQLSRRAPARLTLSDNRLLAERAYLPRLRITAFGEGPELAALAKLAQAMDFEIACHDKGHLTLGQQAAEAQFDQWTAALFLFHDHDWEVALLEQALASRAFFIGAQGGENARVARSLALVARGVAEENIARITSPIGLIPACKTPAALALSALAEVVGQYERLRDAA